MSIELPGEVVSFLQFIGVNWPNVNEDAVKDVATHVRQFADDIHGTHQEATSTIQTLGSSYSGASYEQLVASWGRMSSSHMTELTDACHTVATALDVAAGAITAAKVVAVAELVALAVSFVADQAAAVFTFGLAEAAELLVIEAAKKCVNFLEQQLEQMIIGDVIEAAIGPLEQTVERALGGMVFKGLESALGVSSAGGAAGAGFSMEREGMMRAVQTLQGHADTVVGHAQALNAKLSSVSFA